MMSVITDLEDRPQSARAGLRLSAFRAAARSASGSNGQADVLEFEQLLVLLGQRVLRLDEDAHQRLLVERLERHQSPAGARPVRG